MKRGITGRYTITTVAGEETKAFVPNNLPPDPSIEFDAALREASDRALLALGRLDGLAAILPEPALFIYMYIRKEAVLSSQIEGTQSTLTDLLLHENKQAPGVPVDDVQEVSNYVAAMNHGIKRLKEDFPISSRLIKEMHAILLSKGRGSGKNPGEFRRSQNWIGGTRPGNAYFVPPPPEAVSDCMGALEKFIHDQPDKTPILVKAALAHVQFETIHPFLDGNGRIGRLLVTLLLQAHGAQSTPLLYLSLHFKRNRQAYYELLNRVRLEGDYESWLLFFFDGVTETAEQAIRMARRLNTLLENDRKILEDAGKRSGTMLRVHHFLQRHPVTPITRVVEKLKSTYPTVAGAMEEMERLGVVRELTGGERNRQYAYEKYLRILNDGTEV